MNIIIKKRFLLYKGYKFKCCIGKSGIKKNKIELFHQPNFITYDLSIKNISSIHDLSWIHFPNFFPENDLKTFDLYIEKTLKNSTKIIVFCNSIKNSFWYKAK